MISKTVKQRGFMQIKYIEMRNIQSHVHSVFEFPEKGLVRFKGLNSNGKSVFFKVLADTIRGRLYTKKERIPLVRRGCQSGQLLVMRNDGTTLLVNIDREASQTYVEIKNEEKELNIRRYVTTETESVGELIKAFGFHYLESRDVSLNLYETYDPLILVTTPNAFNEDLTLSALTDKKTESAVVSMREIVDKLEAAEKHFDNQILTNQTVISNIRIVDEEMLELDAKKLRVLSTQLSLIKGITPTEFTPIPKITGWERVNKTEPGRLSSYVEALSIVRQSVNIKQVDLFDTVLHEDLATRVTAYKNEICFACGRKLHDKDCTGEKNV